MRWWVQNLSIIEDWLTSGFCRARLLNNACSGSSVAQHSCKRRVFAKRCYVSAPLMLAPMLARVGKLQAFI
eukprot:583084-Amphidinium_carterae.1